MSERDYKLAIKRGALCRCPSCGKGKVFQGYLKLRPACPICGEAFDKIRTADGPAFFTICVMCLFLIPAQLIITRFTGENVLLSLFLSFALITSLTLALLRPMKSVMLAAQWASYNYES